MPRPGPGTAQLGDQQRRRRARRSASMQLGASLSWELDFWGKFRRASESARAADPRERVGTARGRHQPGQRRWPPATSRCARSISSSRSRRARSSRAQESLRLTQVRESGGATSLVDVRQAEQLGLRRDGAIVDLQRQIEQQENFLSVLLGGIPAPIARGRALTEQPHAPEVPAGLAVGAARAASRHPAGRAAAGRGQRARSASRRRRTFRRSR